MVTLLVPTMNRSMFIIRLLRYYWCLGFEGCICIGDSSSPEHVERTQKAVEMFKSKLQIVYQKYPHLNDAQCIQQLLDFVSTPYVAFIADDDFLVPTALDQCTAFLDRHSDYIAAHGLAAVVRLQSGGPYGQPVWAGYYGQPVIERESASQRLLKHLSSYSVTLFSVHRVEAWRIMFRDVALLHDKSFGSELLPCCLSVIQGKVMKLDCFYMVRQDHGQRYFLPDTYDWITGEQWQPSYLIFRERLVEALVQQDGITLDEARSVVKQAFWSYLIRQSNVEWQGRYAQADFGSLSRWRRVARAIPGARRTWHLLRSLRSKEHDKFSLAALLNPSSPYHADFIPIYRAITTPPLDTDLRGVGETEEIR